MFDFAVSERPTTLDDIKGNDNNIMLLKRLLLSDKPPKTYLLTGGAGSGKTTTALCMKSFLKCDDINFKSINSANDRGIDAIRNIINTCAFTPFGGGPRVIFMDEVHTMPKVSWTALLKLLEEPPHNTYLILATNEPNELPDTVLSRCIRVNLEPMNNELLLSDVVKPIVDKYSIKTTRKVATELVRISNGNVRQLLKLLSIIAETPIEMQLQTITNTVTIIENTPIYKMYTSILKGESYDSILRNIKLTDDIEKVRRGLLTINENNILTHVNNLHFFKAFSSRTCFEYPLSNLCACIDEYIKSKQ